MPLVVHWMGKMIGERGKDNEREQSRERGQEREGKAQVYTDRMVRLEMTVSRLAVQQKGGQGLRKLTLPIAPRRLNCFVIIGGFAEN